MLNHEAKVPGGEAKVLHHEVNVPRREANVTLRELHVLLHDANIYNIMRYDGKMEQMHPCYTYFYW